MILVCKSCGTKFSTTKEAIGNNGRFVRCSLCDYEWLAQYDELIDNLSRANGIPQNEKPNKKSILDIPCESNEMKEQTHDLRSEPSRSLVDEGRYPRFNEVMGSNPKAYKKEHQGLHVSLKQSWLRNAFFPRKENEKRFFVIIFSLFLFVIIPLAVFVWGLEHPESMRNTPLLIELYQKIGVYAQPQWNTAEPKAYVQKDSILLSINIMNQSETIKVIDKMRIIITDTTKEILSDSVVEPHKILSPLGSANLSIKLPIDDITTSEKKQLFCTLYVNKQLIIDEKEIIFSDKSSS